MKTKLLALLITLALIPSFIAVPVQAKTIDEAIDAGIAWLAAPGRQNSDGSWGTAPQCNPPCPQFDYRLGTTALAVLKLEDYAWEHKNIYPDGPFDDDYPYKQNVVKGLVYIFSKAHKVQIFPQDAGNPDTHKDHNDSYGYGISFSPIPNELETYEAGVCMMAIAASRSPGRVVTVTGSEVNNWTYKEVLCEAVDYLAYGQCDNGNGRGGWHYSPNDPDNDPDTADNSCTGYAVIGLQYAENSHYCFSCTIPDFVKTELRDQWIPRIQATNAPCKGGAGYHSGSELPRVSTLLTGNLLCEMAFVGKKPNDGKVVDALAYISAHWNEPNVHPGWRGNASEKPYYQAAYCLMRGLQTMDIANNGIPGIADWYTVLATVLVGKQNPEGSWTESYTAVEPIAGDGLNKYPDSDGVLSTVWALLALERAAPPPPCECEGWNPVTAAWTDASGKTGTWTGKCGDTITIASSTADITVSTSENCSFGCAASENWTVTSSHGPIAHGDGTTATFTATSCNDYTVIFNATCGRANACSGISENISCDPCTITVTVCQEGPVVQEPVLKVCASPCVGVNGTINLFGWLEPPSPTAVYSWTGPQGGQPIYAGSLAPVSVFPASEDDTGVWTLTVTDQGWTQTATVNVKVPCDNCTCEGWNPVTVSWTSGTGINTLTGNCGQKPGLIIPAMCCETTVKVSSSENCSCQNQLFDVYLLADTTISMKSAIDKLKATADILVNALAFCNPNIALGVGYYQDFEPQYIPYGGCFKNLLSPNAYTSPVQAKVKILQWPDGPGGDPDEGQLYALYQLATDPSIGWRQDAKRIIVWFGDNPGHEPICAGLGWLVSDLTEDIVRTSLVGSTPAETITVLAINMTTGFTPNLGLDGNPQEYPSDTNTYTCYQTGTAQTGTAGQATRITTATGGKYLPNANVSEIRQAIVDIVTDYVANFVTQVPATYEFEPSDVGVYPVTLTASCDNITCPPCNIDVLVRDCTKPEAVVEVVTNSSLCPQLFTLTGKPDDMMEYKWTGPPGFPTAYGQILNIDATNWTPGDYNYTLTVTDANGCTDNETVAVNVLGFPDCNGCNCESKLVIDIGWGNVPQKCIPQPCACIDILKPLYYFPKWCWPEENQPSPCPPPVINNFEVGPGPSFGGPCIPGAPWSLSWDVDVPYTQIVWPAPGNSTHPVYIEFKCTDSNNIVQTLWGPEAFEQDGSFTYKLPADFQPCDRKCEFCLWTYDCNLKKVMKCERMITPCPDNCVCTSPANSAAIASACVPCCPCNYDPPNNPMYCFPESGPEPPDASLSVDTPCACLYPGSTEFNVNLTGSVSGANRWTLTASSGGSSTVIASAQNLDPGLTYPVNKNYAGGNLGPNLVPITFTLTANGPGGSDTATVIWEFCPHQLTITSFTGGVYTGTAWVAPALACKQGTNWTLAWHLTSINAPVGWEPSVSIAIRCPDLPNTPDVGVGTFTGLDGSTSFKLPKDYCDTGCYFLLHTEDCAGNDIEAKVFFAGGEGSKPPPTPCPGNCDCLTEREALDLGYTTLCQQEPCSAAGEPQKFCYSRCPEGCSCVTEKEADELGYTISCSDEKCDPTSKEAKYCFSPPMQPCSQRCQCLTQAQAKEYGYTDAQRCQTTPCKQDPQGKDMYCYPKPKAPVVDVTADRSFVTLGGDVRVCWAVAGEGITEVLFTAAGGKPTPVDPKGCKTFRPSQQTRYLVTAKNAAGSGQDAVTVGVGQPPPPEEVCPTITSFTANCPTAQPGTPAAAAPFKGEWTAQPCTTCCTASWSVVGPAGTTVSISGIGNVGLSGSTQVQRGATYTLTARYGTCIRTATVQVPKQ